MQEMYVYGLISVLCFFADATLSEMALHTTIQNVIDQVTRSHFIRSPCAVFVSEETEPLTDVNLDELPIMRIIIEKKDVYDDKEGTQEFERLLGEMLDAGCSIYILQVADVKSVVQSVARAVTKSVQRIRRDFILLPSVNTTDMYMFTQEVLSMKQLEILPNVLIARIHTNLPVPVSLEEVLSVRSKLCTDGSPQLDPTARKFIENLSFTTKNTKTKQGLHLSRPKLRATTQNNVITAIELLTQRFVGPNPSEEVFLDIWMQFGSEGFFILCADLYPDVTRDLQGKILTAVAVPYLPFVIIDHYAMPPLNEGVEFRVYQELLKKLNGTSRMIYDPEHLWGAIFENGTGNGIVGSVLNGDADIGFAALYQNWYNEWLWTDFSYPYCQSSSILVAPRPKLLPGYFVPVLPFSPRMWTAVLLSIVVISVCICSMSAALHRLLSGFTKQRISFCRSFLDTLAILVLQVPNEGNEESRYPPWKHFMVWISVYSLLITSVYSGGLASILTLPRYEHPINTLVDMATSNFVWMFPHEAAIWAFQDTEDPVLKTIADKYIKVSDEKLEDIALKGEVAIYIEQLSGGVFSYGSYISVEAMSKLRLMKEAILVAHVVLIARKGGPYMQPLNDLILALNQGGLGTYWQADVVRNFLSSRLQLQIALSRNEDDPDGNTPRTLQLSHVQGAFILLGLGSITACFVFVIELMRNRLRKPRYHM